MEVSQSFEELQEQIGRLENALTSETHNLKKISLNATEKELLRKELWIDLRKRESKNEILIGLEKRFLLLNEQYLSDIKRLEAIIEVGLRIGEIEIQKCPTCGKDIDLDKNEQGGKILIEASMSYQKELQRIKTFQADLQNTKNDVIQEQTSLKNIIEEKSRQLKNVEIEIERQFKPMINETLLRINEIDKKKSELTAKINLFERIEQLNKLIKAHTPTKKKKTKDDKRPETKEIELLCEKIEGRLSAWKFPDAGRVSFNYNKSVLDVIVSGRDRNTHGKGVRAIIHSAFTLGLLEPVDIIA